MSLLQFPEDYDYDTPYPPRDLQQEMVHARAQPAPEAWLEHARPSTQVRLDAHGTPRLYELHSRLDDGHLAAARQMIADARSDAEREAEAG